MFEVERVLDEQVELGQKDMTIYACGNSPSYIQINGELQRCQVLLIAYVGHKDQFCIGRFWGKKIWDTSDYRINSTRILQVIVDESSSLHIFIDNDEHLDFTNQDAEFIAVYAITDDSTHVHIRDASCHVDRNEDLFKAYGDNVVAQHFIIMGLFQEYFPHILN